MSWDFVIISKVKGIDSSFALRMTSLRWSKIDLL